MQSQSSSAIDAGDSARYLSFTMGKEEFAIPLLSVKEVVALPVITPVPKSAPHFVGVMNLRGQVISVIDLRKKMNIKFEASTETTVILSDVGGLCVGYIVDNVSSVLVAGKADIADPPSHDHSLVFIKGILKNKNSLVMLLDLPRLDSEDHQAARKTA